MDNVPSTPAEVTTDKKSTVKKQDKVSATKGHRFSVKNNTGLSVPLMLGTGGQLDLPAGKRVGLSEEQVGHQIKALALRGLISLHKVPVE